MLATDGVTLVGRYLLEDRLGHGGMGSVWRARDLVLGRQVAIKLTDRPGAARGAAERRLRREAMVISSLTERRLARVYDYFETEDGSFIVMELVRGESLSARIKREGRLPLAEAAWIVAECAEALHAAHRAGVVHRDVKPSNIMLQSGVPHAGTVHTGAVHTESIATQQDVKIVDFGIAARTRPAVNRHPCAPEPVEVETETMTGNILGTIAYLAPERVSGAPDSPAADLYSLGVVFYQLLSGRLPFQATEPIAVLCAHADGRAAPLPDDIPPPVAELCLRLMARDPADRPASGAAAAAELRALDVEHPELLWARRESIAPRSTALISRVEAAGADRFVRADRQVKALVAAVSLAAMATAGCTAWLVSGFGAQAAGNPQPAISRPASSGPSTPHSAQPISSVVLPNRSSNAAPVTKPVKHAAARQTARSGDKGGGKGGGDKGGDNGGEGDGGGAGAAHGKHKGHG